MPDSLIKLLADGASRITWLPRLPTERMQLLSINTTAIRELHGLPARIDELCCNGTPIQRLPKQLPSCRVLCVNACSQLQQLPEHLPADLVELYCKGCSALQRLPDHLPAGLKTLDCSGCGALRQLPAQLPPALEYLQVFGCTALRQLPELPPSLKVLSCSGCSRLQQVPDASKTQALVLSGWQLHWLSG
uniref:Uncharacterized protein n=1 Tax=Tetradesmus obliquus TaxID=3088 RepID=A0A383WBE1_TETOB|eukprot:jgi/Sobl393_1/16707/SZX74409.1